MRNAVVVYHAGCTDGAMAGAIFAEAAGSAYPSVAYHTGVYNKTLPPAVNDSDIFLLDFSLSPDQVAGLLLSNTVTVIDHHKDAVEALKKVQHGNLDMLHSNIEYSGAECTYRALIGGDVPLVVRLIGDRDMWRFEYEITRNFSAGLNLLEKSHVTMQEVLNWGEAKIMETVQNGQTIGLYNAQLYKSHIKQCTRTMQIGGIYVPICNANGAFASELCEVMYDVTHPEAPFVGTYYDTAMHRCFSLRSRKGSPVFVDGIARQYGGNGHPHAAGFKVPRDHILAKE